MLTSSAALRRTTSTLHVITPCPCSFVSFVHHQEPGSYFEAAGGRSTAHFFCMLLAEYCLASSAILGRSSLSSFLLFSSRLIHFVLTFSVVLRRVSLVSLAIAAYSSYAFLIIFVGFVGSPRCSLFLHPASSSFALIRFLHFLKNGIR